MKALWSGVLAASLMIPVAARAEKGDHAEKRGERVEKQGERRENRADREEKRGEAVEKRGEGLKEALPELKGIARGDGSLMDKAKAAVSAIKDPGAPGQDAPQAPAE